MTVVSLVCTLIFHFAPKFGHSHILVYIAICSLMGSLSVRPIRHPGHRGQSLVLWGAGGAILSTQGSGSKGIHEPSVG